MATSDIKSISSDFGGSLKSEQLHIEIVADAGITTTLKGINVTGDVVDIVFDSSISAGEQITLDTLISNHVPDITPELNKEMMTVFEKEVNTTTYRKLTSIIFPGGTHCLIKCSSKMDPGCTNYSIKIYDTTNDITIAEGTFTNTSIGIQNLGHGSNVPSSEVLFEILAKKTGGVGSKKVYIDSVYISYA